MYRTYIEQISHTYPNYITHLSPTYRSSIATVLPIWWTMYRNSIDEIQNIHRLCIEIVSNKYRALNTLVEPHFREHHTQMFAERTVASFRYIRPARELVNRHIAGLQLFVALSLDIGSLSTSILRDHATSIRKRHLPKPAFRRPAFRTLSSPPTIVASAVRRFAEA